MLMFIDEAMTQYMLLHINIIDTTYSSREYVLSKGVTVQGHHLRGGGGYLPEV